MTYDIITKVLNDHEWEGMPLTVPSAAAMLGFRRAAVGLEPEDSFDWLTQVVAHCTPDAVDVETCQRLLLATGQFASPLAMKCMSMVGMGEWMEAAEEGDDIPTE